MLPEIPLAEKLDAIAAAFARFAEAAFARDRASALSLWLDATARLAEVRRVVERCRCKAART